ncbi:hypothetical protein BBJ28_00021649 [Nothophytophthora sp. Chile5]|nr:hypothetical protein BBJ28_00021649 [Nothophytophthora sp. Chile5]
MQWVIDWAGWWLALCVSATVWGLGWVLENRSLLLGAAIGVLSWTVTAPLRSYVSYVASCIYRVAARWAFLLRSCVEGYLYNITSDEALALDAADLRWLRFEALFQTPMAVLKLHLGETERVGQACLRWLDAHHYSWCVLVPDSIEDAWTSTLRYWDGAKIMSAETEALVRDLFWGLWLAIRLSLFSTLYVPAAVYGVVESCCLGWAGVATVLGAANYVTAVSETCLLGTVAVTLWGCCSHGLWWYQESTGTLGLTPWTLALRHWTDLQEAAQRRAQQERISLAVWRAFGDDTASPAPATVPSAFLPGVTNHARTPTAIRAEHRAVELRAVELQREYELSLRAEQARRGRRA